MFIVALFVSQSLWAEDVQVQYRLTGLFQPDRVEDLRSQAGELRSDRNGPVEVRLVNVNYDTAVATFRYDSDSQHFKNRKPEQVLEHLNNMLRGVSRGSFSAFPLSDLKPEDGREEKISVAGLDCKGCAYGAYRAIATIDGVERAIVSFKDGHVTARIDPKKTSREALVSSLKKAQIDVTEP